ncbi:Hypothetical predicted protein, partial [Marmota monax]
MAVPRCCYAKVQGPEQVRIVCSKTSDGETGDEKGTSLKKTGTCYNAGRADGDYSDRRPLLVLPQAR